MGKSKLKSLLYTIKINLKWTRNPNLTTKIIKLLKENPEKNCRDLGLGKELRTQKQMSH